MRYCVTSTFVTALLDTEYPYFIIKNLKETLNRIILDSKNDFKLSYRSMSLKKT